jgi:hypothetical protein
LVSIERRPILARPGHRLFAGFTRTWLGATPVSEILKRELIDSATAKR